MIGSMQTVYINVYLHWMVFDLPKATSPADTGGLGRTLDDDDDLPAIEMV